MWYHGYLISQARCLVMPLYTSRVTVWKSVFVHFTGTQRQNLILSFHDCSSGLRRVKKKKPSQITESDVKIFLFSTSCFHLLPETRDQIHSCSSATSPPPAVTLAARRRKSPPCCLPLADVVNKIVSRKNTIVNVSARLCVGAPAAKAFSQSPRSELTDGFHFRRLLKISTSWCWVKIACEPTAVVSAGDNVLVPGTWHTSDGSFTNEPVLRADSFKWTKRAKRSASRKEGGQASKKKKKKMVCRWRRHPNHARR